MEGNQYARFGGPELYAIMLSRNARIGSLIDNLGTWTTTQVPPYAGLDLVDAVAGSGEVTVDVLANDHDANADDLHLVSADATSIDGGQVTVVGDTAALPAAAHARRRQPRQLQLPHRRRDGQDRDRDRRRAPRTPVRQPRSRRRDARRRRGAPVDPPLLLGNRLREHQRRRRADDHVDVRPADRRRRHARVPLPLHHERDGRGARQRHRHRRRSPLPAPPAHPTGPPAHR